MFLLRDKLTKDERDQPEEEAKVQLKVKLQFSDSGTADLIMWGICVHDFSCVLIGFNVVSSPRRLPQVKNHPQMLKQPKKAPDQT